MSIKDNWYPEICECFTDEKVTSRIEGFVGRLKELMNHEIKNLHYCIKCILILSEIWRNKLQTTTKESIDDIIISQEDRSCLSNDAILLLKEELKHVEKDETCGLDVLDCCSLRMQKGFPCRHYLKKRFESDAFPILSLIDFNHIEDMIPTDREPKSNISKEKKKNYTYYKQNFEEYF